MLCVSHVNLAKGFRGGERQTELLIRALAQQGNWRQSLVCRADSPLRDRLSDLPDLQFVTANHQLQGHFGVPVSDLIHAHEAKAVHWAWLHQVLKRTPYVLTRRVPQLIKDKWFNRLIYRAASCAVAISSPIQRHLRERGWTNTTLIPSALAHLPRNESKITALRQLKQAKKVVGHAGALVDRHKGQSFLLQVARLMKNTHPNIEFWFLGHGEDEASLKQQSRDLPNVKWFGFQPDIGNYLAVMDVFAFPSRNEGLGSILLDVMDVGVPIVASRVDGIPDIIKHEQTGLLVDVGDVSGLHEAILHLLESPALRCALVDVARARLQSYTPLAMAESYSQLYKGLVE